MKTDKQIADEIAALAQELATRRVQKALPAPVVTLEGTSRRGFFGAKSRVIVKSHGGEIVFYDDELYLDGNTLTIVLPPGLRVEPPK